MPPPSESLNFKRTAVALALLSLFSQAHAALTPTDDIAHDKTEGFEVISIDDYGEAEHWTYHSKYSPNYMFVTPTTPNSVMNNLVLDMFIQQPSSQSMGVILAKGSDVTFEKSLWVTLALEPTKYFKYELKGIAIQSYAGDDIGKMHVLGDTFVTISPQTVDISASSSSSLSTSGVEINGLSSGKAEAQFDGNLTIDLATRRSFKVDGTENSSYGYGLRLLNDFKADVGKNLNITLKYVPTTVHQEATLTSLYGIYSKDDHSNSEASTLVVNGTATLNLNGTKGSTYGIYVYGNQEESIHHQYNELSIVASGNGGTTAGIYQYDKSVIDVLGNFNLLISSSGGKNVYGAISQAGELTVKGEGSIDIDTASLQSNVYSLWAYSGGRITFESPLSINVKNGAGKAYGVLLQGGSTGIFNNVNITSTNTPNFYGLSVQDSSVKAQDLTINGFGTYGVFVTTSSDDYSSEAIFRKLTVVDDAHQGDKYAVYATNSSLLSTEIAVINPGNWTDYQGQFSEFVEEDKEIDTVAIYSDYDSTVEISRQAQIYGAIVSKTNSKLSLTGEKSAVIGDVFASQSSEISMNLTASKLDGQMDDYSFVGKTYRNTTIFDDVSERGSINLALNETEWIARGKNFVTSLEFKGTGNTVDLSQTDNSSLVIDKLHGSNGIFKMALGNPNNVGTNGQLTSDMLYIVNMDDDAQNQVEVVLGHDVQSFEELDGVRFATTSHVDSTKHLQLKMTDQGAFNRTLSVKVEDYQSDDVDNIKYNGEGDGKGTFKPGQNAVDEMFKNGGSNWLISVESSSEIDPEEPIDPDNPDPTDPGSSLSDAGKAMIATARGTYWTAVEIDRLTNRLGDARYANDDGDGLWIRYRQSRLGTDTNEGDFKSDNVTYQVGYDHAFRYGGGRQLVGLAFDYLDTDLDYSGMSSQGNTDRFGMTAYTTWFADSDFYIDAVGKWGRLANNFNIINGSGGNVKADYDNNIWALSVELGQKLRNPNTELFIEPSIQLQYTYVTDAQYKTNQGTEIDQDGIHSVIGRMGVRIGRLYGKEQNHMMYVKADVFREFLGEQKIHVKDVTTGVNGDSIDIQNKGMWSDIGAGFQSQLGKDAYAYADVEYRFGNDLDKSWLVNAGLRYVF